MHRADSHALIGRAHAWDALARITISRPIPTHTKHTSNSHAQIITGTSRHNAWNGLAQRWGASHPSHSSARALYAVLKGAVGAVRSVFMLTLRESVRTDQIRSHGSDWHAQIRLTYYMDCKRCVSSLPSVPTLSQVLLNALRSVPSCWLAWRCCWLPCCAAATAAGAEMPPRLCCRARPHTL